MTALDTSVTTARGIDLPSLRDILEDQQARKIDLVIPGSQIRVTDGELVITGQEDILNEEGFTDPNGTYQVTDRFDEGVAEKLDINPGYLRRLRYGKTNAKGKQTAVPRLDLYDANVNGLLHGRKGLLDITQTSYKREPIPGEARKFLVRLFRSDVTRRGVARALLSDIYARLDNLDGVMAMLAGIAEAGIDPNTLRITGDVTETRLYLHVDAPEIAALAPKLLEGYRSPFGNAAIHGGRQTRGYSLEERRAIGRAFADSGRGAAAALAAVGEHNIYAPEDMPIVFAGFDMMNSEVGNGRWLLIPRITVLECSNGYTFTREAFSRDHRGQKMVEGHVKWSAETQTKELAWVTSQTKDIVKATLTEGFLLGKVEEIEGKCGVEIAEPDTTIDALSSALNWSQGERDGIFDFFMRGGQYTAGGVAQAVTSFSQMLPDADAAFELNNTAMRALELAAR